eukprot:Nitzschia sp. Nitz4//scaffold263_size26989//115//7620//NITZ4_008223-RA/size26989-processed-gene-0.20-mRNA-1//1//CDS//3329544763//6985//frame0
MSSSPRRRRPDSNTQRKTSKSPRRGARMDSSGSSGGVPMSNHSMASHHSAASTASSTRDREGRPRRSRRESVKHSSSDTATVLSASSDAASSVHSGGTHHSATTTDTTSSLLSPSGTGRRRGDPRRLKSLDSAMMLSPSGGSVASTGTAGSGSAAAAAAANISSEDEIERIRRLRAERMQRSGGAATGTITNSDHSAAISQETSLAVERVRERRREREQARASGGGAEPTRSSSHDAMPAMRRRPHSPRAGRRRMASDDDSSELAAAVLASASSPTGTTDPLASVRARRELRMQAEAAARARTSPTRTQSSPAMPPLSRDGASTASAAAAAAASRREDSAMTRAMQRRERLAALHAEAAKEATSTPSIPPPPSTFSDAVPHEQVDTIVSLASPPAPTRHAPPHSNSIIGNEKFRARPKDAPVRRAPPRSMSAEDTLLSPEGARTTDLTTRLKERREARAAERAQSMVGFSSSRAGSSPNLAIMGGSTGSGGASVGSGGSGHTSATTTSNARGEVERRLARRRSGDDTLDMMHKMTREKAMSSSSLTASSHHSALTWTVTVRVLSAVDLPLQVLPNVPVCPVLKLGWAMDHTASGSGSGHGAAPSTLLRTTVPKIMSKRDNGSMDFHQEWRWDTIRLPQMSLSIELAAKAVELATNWKRSPMQASLLDPSMHASPTHRIMTAAHNQSTHSTGTNATLSSAGSGHASTGIMNSNHGASSTTGNPREPVRQVSRTFSASSEDDIGNSTSGGLRALWRKATNRKAAELEAAQAAAAVARMLVDNQDGASGELTTISGVTATTAATSNTGGTSASVAEYNVALEPLSEESKVMDEPLTRDSTLASLVIPFSDLSLHERRTTRVEQWYSLDPKGSTEKGPSILLEIQISSPQRQNSREEQVEPPMLEIPEEDPEATAHNAATSLSMTTHRSSLAIPPTTPHGHAAPKEEKKQQQVNVDPILEPGVVDFVAVVGCRDVGEVPEDAKGWLETSPESVILEQFPPNNEFHQKNGRNALLPEMIQWFAFPEGARLWKGTSPPSHTDLNLKRFSASSPPTLAFSMAAFDAVLNCTTTFNWFVIASNSDEYGSKLVKTYAAVLRFYAPAPELPGGGSPRKLWVPMAICLTTSLPIVGIMEAMILRLCENIVPKIGTSDAVTKLGDVHSTLQELIVQYQRPIAGAVNCSIPFFAGDRFFVSVPPRTGLPALPHGKAVVSVCRLLGAEGLNFMLAAILTECKVLIHSQDIADIAMVAEVVTALIYPFVWSLPYIPILPIGMLEFVEAPLSYLLGIPSCNLALVDPRALDDVVVVDLDNGFSGSEYFDGRRTSKKNSKNPLPLPSSTAANVTKAVYRLLRAEEAMDEEFPADMNELSLPRLESESLAEREFRVSIAIEVCGMLRGYQECLGQVFNRDKFLKVSPAILEDRRDHKGASTRSGGKVISMRSKRFLSALVNTQNFQQLLETLEDEDTAFFHEVMEAWEDPSQDKTVGRADKGGPRTEKNMSSLVKWLQKLEDKVPTYRVGNGNDNDDDPFSAEDEFYFNSEEDIMEQSFGDLQRDDDYLTGGDASTMSSFTTSLLVSEGDALKYQPLFGISVEDENSKPKEKVKLRDAIGERRYRVWLLSQAQTEDTGVEVPFAHESLAASKESVLDLTSLISSASPSDFDDTLKASGSNSLRQSTLTPEQQRVADAKDRDIIRRCLDRSKNKTRGTANPFLDNGRDLLAEAEKALRNPTAQRFLLSIMSQRSRLDSQRIRPSRRGQGASQASASRLDPIPFDCLVTLSCAMLDSCMEFKEYEAAYRLLTLTAGFFTLDEEEEEEEEEEVQNRHVITMTSKIGMHPIFAELSVWETVMSLHLNDRQTERKSTDSRLLDDKSVDDDDEDEDDDYEYEAAVATLYEMVGYGIPGVELSRFAMRASESYRWLNDDRGRQLLVLARRISVRRDQADSSAAAADSVELGMIARSQEDMSEPVDSGRGKGKWTEVGWCHPAAPSARSQPRSMTQDEKNPEDRLPRSAVTALGSFGSSVVVTGGLDGGVFLAYSIEEESDRDHKPCVHGIHLDWGSAIRSGVGSSSDGEYGVGAVSCIAAASGGGHHPTVALDPDEPSSEEFLDLMDGSRVAAGTTGGDLRVWSVRDICSALLAVHEDAEAGGGTSRYSSGVQSRLRFSLRGRSLSGHRGGVTCMDLPSQVYRPDSLVTGGADGLVKLWSLRAPSTSGRRSGNTATETDKTAQRAARGGDAISVLSGHTGRIQCIQTAWHGDRLLSGGADRTARVWDLATSGKCLHVLSGHSGWVTHVQYWGSNTIVTGSSDRSLALWDARIQSAPLFLLRHHTSPISDMLVGSRTDPMMVSAASDGSVATWDFRVLSQNNPSSGSYNTMGGVGSGGGGKKPIRGNQPCQMARNPRATMSHCMELEPGHAAGPVFLCRSVTHPTRRIWSIGSDAIVREWDMLQGHLESSRPSGHADAISNMHLFGKNHGLSSEPDYQTETMEGTLSGSWDGTVLLRRWVSENEANP